MKYSVPLLTTFISLMSLACQGDIKDNLSMEKEISEAPTSQTISKKTTTEETYTKNTGTNPIECSGKSWTQFADEPQLNKAHIFCGEISRRGKAKGFHSRPNGNNPSTVTHFKITQRPNASGIYGGIASMDINGKKAQKFSTLFPDSCSAIEIINSIRYAATHPSTCPKSAPHWADCGFNRPKGKANSTTIPYCTGDNDASFTIAFATLKRGGINTAFPLYRRP